jgi:hypothetical protein
MTTAPVLSRAQPCWGGGTGSRAGVSGVRYAFSPALSGSDHVCFYRSTVWTMFVRVRPVENVGANAWLASAAFDVLGPPAS